MDFLSCALGWDEATLANGADTKPVATNVIDLGEEPKDDTANGAHIMSETRSFDHRVVNDFMYALGHTFNADSCSQLSKNSQNQGNTLYPKSVFTRSDDDASDSEEAAIAQGNGASGLNLQAGRVGRKPTSFEEHAVKRRASYAASQLARKSGISPGRVGRPQKPRTDLPRPEQIPQIPKADTRPFS